MAYRVLVENVFWVCTTPTGETPRLPDSEKWGVLGLRPDEKLEKHTVTLLEQVVEELDLPAVIRVVNGL